MPVDMGEFSPATWGSNYNACHIPGWAPDAADSALGQLQAHMGSNSKWNTIREAFMRADTDGNGVIMRDELQVMCREMHLSSDTAAALLNQFDLDENGEWNYAEFCEVLKKQDYVTYADCVPRDQFRRTDPKRMPSPVPAIKPTARQYDMLNGAALSYVEADAAMQLSAPKQAAQYSPKSWRGEGASSYQADWIQGGGSMEGSMIGSLVAGQSVRARAARRAHSRAACFRSLGALAGPSLGSREQRTRAALARSARAHSPPASARRLQCLAAPVLSVFSLPANAALVSALEHLRRKSCSAASIKMAPASSVRPASPAVIPAVFIARTIIPHGSNLPDG